MTKVSTPSAVRPSSWAPDQVSRTVSPLTVTDSWRAAKPARSAKSASKKARQPVVPYVYLVGLHEPGVGGVVSGDAIEVAGLDRVPVSLEDCFGVSHEFTLPGEPSRAYPTASKQRRAARTAARGKSRHRYPHAAGLRCYAKAGGVRTRLTRSLRTSPRRRADCRPGPTRSAWARPGGFAGG